MLYFSLAKSIYSGYIGDNRKALDGVFALLDLDKLGTINEEHWTYYSRFGAPANLSQLQELYDYARDANPDVTKTASIKALFPTASASFDDFYQTVMKLPGRGTFVCY